MEIGTRLGPFEIVAPLGAGGMGEVYRARDTKLGREVAVKVLPEAVSQDPEKLARFGREAHLLASVNHPNIATLYGLEESNGQQILVMELVEGETLAERLVRGRMPVEEALPLFQDIAEGLETAHEKGIIHRDLKPSNVKITPEGVPKILDFGLAKALVEEGSVQDNSQSPTLTRDATRTGVLLGTAAYMSPEQARGKSVDKRTDIWAFGCCLYEALTGKAVFLGETVSDTIAKILQGEPEWRSLPVETPSLVITLLRRCLTKDRKERLQAIGEARFVLEHYRGLPEQERAVSAPSRKLERMLWGLVAVVTGATVWMATRPHPELPTRLAVTVTNTDRPVGRSNSSLSLSPNGRDLVFSATREGVRQLFRRPMNQLEVVPISGTDGAGYPFFSPDGEWVGFFDDGKLKKVSVAGGPPETLCDAGGGGASWGPNETIVLGSAAGLMLVPASGGVPEALTSLDVDESGHYFPEVLPGGKAVLFTLWSSRLEDARIAVHSLETGETRILVNGTYPRYASTGHIVFARAQSLWAAPFDSNRLEVTGVPAPVLEGAHVLGNGLAQFALADNGSLVYVSAEDSSEEVPRELVRVDREGNATPLTETLGDYETPRCSPDGQRVAVRMGGEPNQDVWILELSRGTLQRLTFDQGFRPLWSPDGRTIFFSSNRAIPQSIFSKPADGSGPAEQLTAGLFRVPAAITSDGKTLVFRGGGGEGSPPLDIGLMRLDAEAEPEMLLETAFHEHTPKLSPDDRWLAYVSNESGRDEVYVTRFPRGGKWQISSEGGREPMFSRDGRELFYRNGEKMMVVDVSAGADKAGKPTLLFEGPYDLKDGPGATNYDVSPDGKWFVMVRTPESVAITTQINVVLNWHEELKRLVPVE